MSGMELIDPTEVYNLLNQGTTYPRLSDPNYLLLIDARSKDDYAESHVLTAKNAPKGENDEFLVPYDAELECKQHVVVYDSNTRSLKEEGAALSCSKVLWDMGSRSTVKILKGGYEDFSALSREDQVSDVFQYITTVPTTSGLQEVKRLVSGLLLSRHAIVTETVFQELDAIRTYPTEVLPGVLFLGNWRQGNAAYIQKDIKVKGHINCCEEEESFFREQGPNLMHIPVQDNEESDIQSKFRTACEYIDGHRETEEIVLVFSHLGISRSATVVLAYLMHHFKWPLKDAWSHLLKCCPSVRPNRGFIQQLSQWEQELFGQQITDISDPNF